MPKSSFVAAQSPAKILLVDDRKENLLALSVALRDEGYVLVEASSGREAVEKALSQDFAAILLDVQMPDIDGFETAHLIREMNQTKATPIIFITAIHRTEAHAHRGYNVGAIDYIFKPIDVDILRAKLSILTQLYQRNIEVKLHNQRLQDRVLHEKENLGLKEALEARDEFLSMAAHELKTPITPLNLQLQYFLRMVRNETLKSVDKDTLERMIVTAYSQVERLSETIDKLMDVSRFSTGRAEINFEVVNLVDLVKQTLNSFAVQLKDLGCPCSLKVTGDVVGVWDPFRIAQVFINLLSNSMKYGPGRPIEIEIQSEEDMAILKVRDFGIGIAEEDQTRIFHRFEKASSSKNYGGLGLGLYIAGEIVRHHNGSLQVNSEPDRGATFIVRLPKSQTFFGPSV